MDTPVLALLALAAAAAGAINSIAGGGSLISFPAALAAGLSPVTASVTNTIALAPGSLASAWAYRPELGHNLRLTLLLSLPAALGSLLGATLLLAAPESVFETIVPWLVLSASAVLFAKDVLWRRAASAHVATPVRTVLVGFGLLVLAVYGGYFGAGMGIVVLALIALIEHMNIHQMNAMKSIIAGTVNATAAVYFVVLGAGSLSAALAMAAGSLVGGYGGAALARRVAPDVVRWVVVAIGVALSVVLAWRRWG
jgi:uncharacterized membrane protein YfcA